MAQREKHHVLPFEDKLRGFFDAYEIQHVERYVWD
jgi:hypothetical protein